MSNDHKSGIVNDDRGGAGRNEPNRGHDLAPKPRQQSQDAARRQQDGSPNPKEKNVQQGDSDMSGQQSQGGSQKDSGGMKQRGSDELVGGEIRADESGHRSQSK
jgi:hypothetical protein